MTAGPCWRVKCRQQFRPWSIIYSKSLRHPTLSADNAGCHICRPTRQCRPTMLARVTRACGGVCLSRIRSQRNDTHQWILFMTASLYGCAEENRTKFNCTQWQIWRHCTVEANRHEASRGLSARAELLVPLRSKTERGKMWPPMIDWKNDVTGYARPVPKSRWAMTLLRNK